MKRIAFATVLVIFFFCSARAQDHRPVAAAAFPQKEEAFLYGPCPQFSGMGSDAGEKLYDDDSAECFLYVDPEGLCDDNWPCSDSIQEALDFAPDGCILMLEQGQYAEKVLMKEAKQVTLNGGMEADFQTVVGQSFTKGLEIVDGSLIVKNIGIQSDDAAQGQLFNNQAVTGLSGTKGSEVHYWISVPESQASLEFRIWGGSGDADLYVRRGAPCSTSIYDFCSCLDGNNETVTVADPQAGYWYVMLHGASSYSGLNLMASYAGSKVLNGVTVSGPAEVNESSGAQYNCTAHYSDDSNSDVTGSTTWSENSGYASIDSNGYLTTSSVTSDQAVTITAGYGGKSDTHDVTIKDLPTPLVNGQAMPISGSQGSETYYRISVPANQSTLVVETKDGSGDAQLWVKKPGSSQWVKSETFLNTERQTFNNPQEGDWQIALYGKEAYSGASLKATYSVGSKKTLSSITIKGYDCLPENAYAGYRAEAIFLDAPREDVTIWANWFDSSQYDAVYPTSEAEVGLGTAYFGDGPRWLTLEARYSHNEVQKSTSMKVTIFDGSRFQCPNTHFGASTPLNNGQSVANLSGAFYSMTYFKISVPAGSAIVGSTRLVVETWGGTGDVDIGVTPIDSSEWQQHSDGPYNDETVTVSNPAAGEWLIGLFGADPYSGVNLRARYEYESSEIRSVLQ